MSFPYVEIEYDGDLWLLRFNGQVIDAYTDWDDAVDDIKPKLIEWNSDDDEEED